MWQFVNPNPAYNFVGDCVVRALSIALDSDWDTIFLGLAAYGFDIKDMPSGNAIWSAYLRDKGFKRYIIPNECPNCYTLKDFCEDHPNGIFVIGTGTHAVAVIDGDYYDSWDSGNVIPIYYFTKE
jgi:hypothetical protein